MKFYLPLTRNPKESQQEYIHRCSLLLMPFKSMLKANIKQDKLRCRNNMLTTQPNIKIIPGKTPRDMVSIANLYITYLQCFYDISQDSCYFEVPKSIRCPSTTTPLDTVVRILEYGGAHTPPLYWIRPTYRYFIETTVNH